ncbi:hypothetical protein CP877_11160 [Cutibacterium modestum]|nr:hypothetical protein CP877_11160 [Cutibacterium modestum]
MGVAGNAYHGGEVVSGWPSGVRTPARTAGGRTWMVLRTSVIRPSIEAMISQVAGHGYSSIRDPMMELGRITVITGSGNHWSTCPGESHDRFGG